MTKCQGQDLQSGHQFSVCRAFLVAQLLKNQLAMWETWVWSLGWEDPLENGKAPHSRILAWESHELCRPWSGKVLDMTEDSHFTSLPGPFPLRREVPQGNHLKLSLWCSKRFYTLKQHIVPRFRFDEGHGFLFSRKGRKWEMEKNLKNALKAQSQAGQL